ncbi:MAG: restriction endonuclease subunit S [Balneolaceae bacterium]
MNKEVSRYPTYKYSGIDWLGEIPANWQLKPLKYVVDIDREKLKDSEDPDLEFEYIDISSVDSGGNILKREKLSFENAPSRARRVVQKGDTILATVRTYLRAITQIDYVSELSQICSTGFAVLRPVKIQSRFLFYWVRSDYFIDEVVSRSVGVSYPAISSSDVGNLSVPILPEDEQKAIATFLDRQTTRIDQLIEKKKRILELLDEQRQAIITRAVTKGFDSDARMKDSGIEWLGDVPEHWDIEKLKYFVQLNNREIEVYEEVDMQKVALENIESGTGRLFFSDDDKAFQGKGNSFAPGDVLFNKLRPYLAKVVCAEFHGVAVGELLVLSPDKTALNSRYLYHRMLSEQFIKIVNNSTYGAKMPRANWDFIGNLRIGIPPIDEQKEIVEFLDQQIEKNDYLNEKIQKAIETLNEYRSSLITQAVTGKIDVRDQVKEKELNYAAEDGVSYQTN